MFRPSDDATIYPFLVASNFFAFESLMKIEEISSNLHYKEEQLDECRKLLSSLNHAIDLGIPLSHPKYGEVIPYEVDGFGNFSIMDDANIPSILSLPYLTSFSTEDHRYKNTRRILLSENNPFFFKGKAAEGIGGPHVGMDYIWPMSIIMRGLTSTDDKEIKFCLDMLQKTHAGTGFMHESFHKDDATKFTRKWFAWANTLFGEFVWKVYKERPHLLK
jgi:meiotically up-regulated gene 157 (Mug157) protein